MSRATEVTIRGRTFPTHRAAAAHYGVTPACITMLKKRGRLDRVGLGTGAHRMSDDRQAARAARVDRERDAC
jgi:hypothetical protein